MAQKMLCPGLLLAMLLAACPASGAEPPWQPPQADSFLTQNQDGRPELVPLAAFAIARQTTLGQIGFGPECRPGQPVTWRGSSGISIADERLSATLRQLFLERGYALAREQDCACGDAFPAGSLEIRGTVTAMTLNICHPDADSRNSGTSTVELDVEWKLQKTGDAAPATVIRNRAGFNDAFDDGDYSRAVDMAFHEAARDLLKRPEFHALMPLR